MLASGIGIAILPMPALAEANGELAAYVRARAADADGKAEIAAAGYAAALAAEPDNEVIAIRAYREALAVGDFALARRSVAVLRKSGVAPPDADILRFADAVATRDWKTAKAAADALGKSPLDFMGPVLNAWLAFQSRSGDPIAILDAAETNALTRRYAGENRALLLIALGRTDEGVAALRTLLGDDQGSLDLRLNAAMLLAGKGKDALAHALLAGPDPVLSATRERLGDGTRATAAFGASRLFTRLAVDLSRDETSPLAIMLTRSALRLDPSDDRARLLLADALSHEGSVERALEIVGQIAPDGPFARSAGAARVMILSRAGRDDAALEAARTLVSAPGAGAAEAQSYGDLLAGRERYADAADAYALALQRAGGEADWVLYLQLGGALEQAGRWDEALPHLRRAVELAPDEPVALNYLGYAQIERGVNVAAAQELLERAARLRPDDPAITDSLGWAYFQRGQVAKALPLLEKAAQAQPADTTINEHLGDAYWKLGRHYEARYAWRAAAVYAEGKDASRIADKIARGLEAGRAR